MSKTKYIQPRNLEGLVRAIVFAGLKITNIKRNGKVAKGGEIAVTFE